jgi:hypothetical protein
VSSKINTVTTTNTSAAQDQAIVLAGGSTYVQNIEIADTDALRMAGDLSREAVSASRATGLAAIYEGGSLGRAAIYEGGSLGRAAISGMEGFTRDAFGLARDLTLSSTAEVRRAAGESLTMAEDATKSALAFASQATRSDTSQALENIAKWAALGGAAVAIFSFLKGGKTA